MLINYNIIYFNYNKLVTTRNYRLGTYYVGCVRCLSTYSLKGLIICSDNSCLKCVYLLFGFTQKTKNEQSTTKTTVKFLKMDIISWQISTYTWYLLGRVFGYF